MSMVPSDSPRMRACLSSSVRRGGFTLAREPLSRTRSSVAARCCGVTSPYTLIPIFFAARITSTVTPLDMCCISSFAPIFLLSMMSLAARTYSASSGAPPSPSFSETAPLFTPALYIRAGSSSCSEMGTSSSLHFANAFTMSFSSAIGTPSSVNPTAPAESSASISVSSLPCIETVTLAV